MKIVRQRDLKDCGVCCLLSIIRYYGGDMSLEQMRLDAKVDNNGTTALNLLNASQRYGFDSYGIKTDTLENKNIILPAIAHLNLNGYMHYVTIYKITNTKVILMDPAKGRVVMSIKDFLAVWSQVLLVFYPRMKITVFKNNNNLFILFKKIICSEKKLFLIITILSILLMLLTIAGSYYFQIVINAINQNYYINYLKLFSLVFAVIVIFKTIFSYYRKYLENHLNKNIDVYLNLNFLNHLYNLPLEVITSRTSGEIITRVNELANIKSIFTEVFISCLLDLGLAITSLPLLIMISSKLSLVLFFFLLTYLITGIFTSKIVYQRAYQNIEYEAKFNNALIEDIKMINSIKNLNVTKKRLKKIEEKLSDYLFDNFKLSGFLNKESGFKNALNELTIFIINTWGFYLILQKNIATTDLVTFNTLLCLFLDPLKNCIDSIPKYNFLKATFTKINDFLSVDIEKKGEGKKLLGNDIEIRDLSYSYNNVNYILKNVSIYIKSSSFVSLSGKSGCGKSTICKILDKYITNYEGEVLIGGVNIKDFDIETIRNNILYINQNECIVTGTIKENIILDRDVSPEKFLSICKLCYIEEIVNKKPLRFETQISDYATNISGGEKERIILARALLNDFQILILDEALSEVDYKLERNIMNNLKKEFPNKTIIYITHKKHENIFDNVINLGGKE